MKFSLTLKLRNAACSITALPEFLKAAIMQSYDCAKYLRICAHFGLINAKQEQLHLIKVFDTNLTVACKSHHPDLQKLCLGVLRVGRLSLAADPQ